MLTSEVFVLKNFLYHGDLPRNWTFKNGPQISLGPSGWVIATPFEKNILSKWVHIFTSRFKAKMKPTSGEKPPAIKSIFSTWRIIPFSKWLITMVSKSPK